MKWWKNMLKKQKEDSFNIYVYDEKYLELGRDILNKNYKEIKKLKDTKRNYVVLIEWKGRKYVLKAPRNEFRIPQRKFFTLVKKGEALTTLVNINNLVKEKGIKEFAIPIVALNKRKLGFIEESYFVMEYFSGESGKKFIEEIMEIGKKIHSFGVYHGDFNPSNFLFDGEQVKIIDTQAKKMLLGNYRAHYDMLTMKMDSYKEMEYPYNKNFWYFMAVFVKKLKRNKIIAKIKKNKQILRDKGWKI